MTPSDPLPAATEEDWLGRLVEAERENHCGDAACMTRRVSAAVRVLTGGKEHQDYCWAVEAFEAELGIRDPALVGAEPSNAILALARSTPIPASNDEQRRELTANDRAFQAGYSAGRAAERKSALAHAPREGLEVELLARALDAEWTDRQINPPDWNDDTDVWVERAKGIAAEYAHLTQPAEETS